LAVAVLPDMGPAADEAKPKGTRGRNALTDGDPGSCHGTGSDKPPGNWTCL